MKSNTEILRDILAIANQDLQQNGDMGYTMPDGKHHIYIYADQETNWDDEIEESFYVIEPNRVVNGAHDPMGDTYITRCQDLSEVLIGCQWCMEVFEEDRNLPNREGELPDELTVRLAHEAGWMEATGKIEIHSWEELQTAIRDAVSQISEAGSERNPFIIEETIEKILLERFPSDREQNQNMDKQFHILICTKETAYGIETDVSIHPSAEEALRCAEEMSREEENGQNTWNFNISTQTVDVSRFPDRSSRDDLLIQNLPQHFHSEPHPQTLVRSEKAPEKKSLNDRIQSARNKLSSEPPSDIPSGKEVTR